MRAVSLVLITAGMPLAGCMQPDSEERSAVPRSDQVAIAAVGPTVSVQQSDAGFAPSLSWRGRQLILNGSGLCEWGFLGIDLYRAALYVEQRVDGAAALAAAGDQVMVFHLDFVRGLTESQLQEAYSTSVEVNTADDFARYEPALQELLATMQAVQAGDTYSFIADPSMGLVVQRNDSWMATIEDQEFRKLFVRLYLGDKPPTAALRDGLLGKNR